MFVSDLRQIGGFSRYSGFIYQKNWLLRYNWNILERVWGLNSINHNPLINKILWTGIILKLSTIIWLYNVFYWSIEFILAKWSSTFLPNINEEIMDLSSQTIEHNNRPGNMALDISGYDFGHAQTCGVDTPFNGIPDTSLLTIGYLSSMQITLFHSLCNTICSKKRLKMQKW